MSIQAVAWVLDHSQAKMGDRLVLVSIANHLNKDLGASWLSYQTMAEEAGLSRREAIRCVKSLVELGELSVERGAGPKSRAGGMPMNLYRMVTYSHYQQAGDGDKDGDIRRSQIVTPPSPEPSTEPRTRRERLKAFYDRPVEEQERLIVEGWKP